MVEAVLLGTAQDAGVPQIGCDCVRCRAARRDPDRRRYPVSLALVDHASKSFWLVDATPAISSQFDFLSIRFPGYVFSGVLLTHAHIGHYTGLVQFGKEAWNVRQFPVWCTARMAAFLQGNEPWAAIARENLQLISISNRQEFRLGESIVVRPVRVAHRAEHTDTLAFRIRGLQQVLFYCPDIDHWNDSELDGELEGVDDALLDGTFFSDDELPGRDLYQIPHPLVSETASRFDGADFKIWLVHLNHSNPLHDEGEALSWARTKGLDTARQWQSWRLS